MSLTIEASKEQQEVARAALENVNRLAAESKAGHEKALKPSIVLDMALDWFRRYIKVQRVGDHFVIVMFAAATHVREFVPVQPRAIFDSLMPGAGKTTVLEHLSRICFNPVMASGISSPALIPRMISAAGDESITVLIDEADRTLDPKKDGVGDMIAVINSGSKRGATRPVLVPDKDNGWKAQMMPTYCSVAMAGNSPILPDDTRSRSVQVFLLPDSSGSIEETDWVSDTSMEEGAKCIHDAFRAWAEMYGNDIQAARPSLPDGCRGRMKERWITYAKIAAVAGGEWPDRVNQLIVDDIERVEAEKADGLNSLPPKALLVQDCLEVMHDEFTPTASLVSMLAMSHPDRWGTESPYVSPLTRQRLAKMLSPIGIHSVRGTTRDDRTRGYRREDIERVSESMTPTHPRGTHGTHGTHGTQPRNSNDVSHVDYVDHVSHVSGGMDQERSQDDDQLDF